MSISIVKNIFSTEDLNFIKNAIDKNEQNNVNIVDPILGRKFLGILKDFSTKEITRKLYKVVEQATDLPLSMANAYCFEYSGKYGKPNLPPHFDCDGNDLIINMQIESNTQWDLGLNLELYTLEDNSALVFNPNTEIHWRVHKEFNEGEYVRMLFVRFCNLTTKSDYSHLPNSPDHSVFKEVKEFRDSLAL
jgi:hypothetical protein